MRLNILMFNMSSYTEWLKAGRVNRNYHILHHLLGRPEVANLIAVDYLPFTWKRACRNWLENVILPSGTKVIWRDLTTKLWQPKIHSSSLRKANLYIYSTIDSIFSEEVLIKKLKKILGSIIKKENQLSREASLVSWSYHPIFANILGRFKENIIVFEAVDNWALHPSYAKFKDKLEKSYQIIKEKADLIFTVSNQLRSLVTGHPDTYWIPNGVSLNHFIKDDSRKTFRMLRSDKKGSFLNFKKIPSPIIGYIGIIQARLDMEVIKYLAERNSDKSFVFIGPIWPDANIELVKGLPNVYFLGAKPYSEAPFYIHQFDLAIIPHKINDFTQSMNPLKLYEYLACGKPVVTTPVSGVEKFKELVEIAYSRQEFDQKIQKCLEKDNPHLQRTRQEAIKEHSWEERVDRMLGLVKSKIKM